MKALQIRDLHKTYKNGLVALDGISLDVARGDFFALLGPNGAGKSTILGLICSLVNKTSGTVHVFEQNIDIDWAAAKQHIGVVPQEFNFSIFENPLNIVANQGGYFGMPRAHAKERAEFYLNELGLWSKRNQPAQRLSGGMKRRLMIARALVHDPKLLILDEPTAGVDIEVRRSMWDFLQKMNDEGTTIILTTHYLEEAEQLCKNIAIINNGQIIADSDMKSLLAKMQVQRFVLDLQSPVFQRESLEGLPVTEIDEVTLEVDLPHGTTMNDLFAKLSAVGVTVTSMRNKSNRLEEMFLSLTAAKSL